MFSLMCVCLPTGVSHMTITYDGLDLTLQGLHPHPHTGPSPPRYGTSLYRDPPSPANDT